jgi:putative transposase
VHAAYCFRDNNSLENYLGIASLSALSSLPEADRTVSLERFQAIRPFLKDDVALARVARTAGTSNRAAWYWVERFQHNGLKGLARKNRDDKDKQRLSSSLRQIIEGLALRRPRPSVAAVYRKAAEAAEKLGEPSPSYSLVYALIRQLELALLTLAHEGSKAYSETFDLVHRTEAEAPNAIWQADHTELKMLVKDEDGKPRRPWLSIILDDYSRAVAGYFLSLSAPSAIQTALAFRHAIWRKAKHFAPHRFRVLALFKQDAHAQHEQRDKNESGHDVANPHSQHAEPLFSQ